MLSIDITFMSVSASLSFLKFLLAFKSCYSNELWLFMKFYANVCEEMIVMTFTSMRFRLM